MGNRPGSLWIGEVTFLCLAYAERVVAFYNKRGTREQWIKEGKGAKMAEVAIPRQIFQEILRLIAKLRRPPSRHRWSGM
jgi:hypothetical protein